MGNTGGSKGSTLNRGGDGYSNRQGGVKRQHDDHSQLRYETPTGTTKVDNLHRLPASRTKVEGRDERLPTVKPVTKMEI
ncbi:hypothetical protein V6N13_059977 [Hibiscus sabdariffa]